MNMYKKSEEKMYSTRDLVTVIVPVFKVEPYIRRCIESITAQTYTNLEIILVDDGSPDSCGSICEAYAETDPRITVIHKRNGGLSDARNAGLACMRGAYVAFVDSDDYAAPEYIERLYAALKENDADISICGEAFVGENPDGSTFPMKRPLRDVDGSINMTSEEALSCMLRQDIFDASAWAKLYRSDFFNDVRFPVGYAYEDIGTTYRLLLKSRNVTYISDHLYFYLQRNGSILHTVGSSKRFWDGLEMVQTQGARILESIPSLQPEVNCRCISMGFHALMGAYQAQDEKLLDYAWERIVKLRRSVIKDKNARPKARIAAILSYLGKKQFLRLWNAISHVS